MPTKTDHSPAHKAAANGRLPVGVSISLGEDEQLLWDLADEMDPEDSCLWIHGTEDQQTIAFTPAGMEYLRDLLAEHKRNRPSPRP